MARPVKVFLDTHAAIFLWEGRADIWGASSRDVLERSALLVSPFVRLELALLREIGKITVEPDEVLDGLASACGVSRSTDLAEDVVASAMRLDWTRDPFDRLIVATAMRHRSVLVTRDRRILEHYERAIW